MVDIYKQELTNLQQEILNLLSIKAGSALNQNRTSKILKVSQPAVAKALPFLEKSGYVLIKKDKASGRFDIKLNRENKRIINIKRTINLNLIYKSGLVEFLEENFPGTTIILFGSFSKGEDTETSDIDIAIIGRKEKKVNLNEYEKIFEKEIFLHFYISFSKIEKELKENLCNGIILIGGIEL